MKHEVYTTWTKHPDNPIFFSELQPKRVQEQLKQEISKMRRINLISTKDHSRPGLPTYNNKITTTTEMNR